MASLRVAPLQRLVEAVDSLRPSLGLSSLRGSSPSRTAPCLAISSMVRLAGHFPLEGGGGEVGECYKPQYVPHPLAWRVVLKTGCCLAVRV
jgi:hypothetical protein